MYSLTFCNKIVNECNSSSCYLNLVYIQLQYATIVTAEQTGFMSLQADFSNVKKKKKKTVVFVVTVFKILLV